MLLSTLGCFSSGQRLFFFLYSPEWLVRSYLGGNSTYFTWEILRAFCQASAIYLQLSWRMLLHNSTVIVTRSPRCISKLGALLSDNIKWAISCLPIWGLLVPSCVCEFGVGCFQWSWLTQGLLVLIQIHKTQRGFSTAEYLQEISKKAEEGQVAPLCTWPDESCKIRRESDHLAKFKERQWRKWTRISHITRVHLSMDDALLGWEGSSPHIDSDPAFMCHEPRCFYSFCGCLFWIASVLGITHLYLCSQRKTSLIAFKGGSSRKRAQFG